MDSKEALKKLRDLLGEDVYRSVLEELAGTTVYFPAYGAAADREERNFQLKDDFYSGRYDVSDLALKYNLSISGVYKILQAR